MDGGRSLCEEGEVKHSRMDDRRRTQIFVHGGGGVTAAKKKKKTRREQGAQLMRRTKCERKPIPGISMAFMQSRGAKGETAN